MVRGLLVVSTNHFFFHKRLIPFFILGEIDLMESRGNGPDYSAQYVEHLVLPFRYRRSSVFTGESTTFEDRSTGVPCHG